MDEQRARIQEDLQGFFDGDLDFETLGRVPYWSDAGLLEVDPLGVVAPRSEADLTSLVRYAAERGLPLHPRGAGTGRSGGAIGPGIVVDLGRHFRRVLEIRGSHALVQAGVVLDRLNSELGLIGRQVGLEPEGSAAHTIGGLVGLDACGVRSPAHGTMALHVEALRVVFSNGEIGELSRVVPLDGDPAGSSFRDLIARRLNVILAWNADHLSSVSSRPSGYAIRDAANPDGSLDLARLAVGAEGTLAIVTEALIRTVPIVEERALVVLPFARLLDATAAVSDSLAAGPSACELFDRRGLTLARELDPFYRDVISESAEAALIVEFESDSGGTALDLARKLGQRMDRSRVLIDQPVEVCGRSACHRLVHLGRAIAPALARVRGPSRPLDLVERLRIPPPRLGEFMGAVQVLMKDHGVGWSVDARAALAEVRVRPYLDLARTSDREKAVSIAAGLRRIAVESGGTVSPGLGPDRLNLIRRQQGPLFNAHRELKFTFDPLNLLNPGKFVGDDAKPIPAALRGAPSEETPEPGEDVPLTILQWPDQGRLQQIAACNNCGECRGQEPALRMCPTFRASHAEAASPRSKVQLLRAIAAGRLEPKAWGSEELKAYADLCVHCNLCESECPSGVDVSALMLEAKAAYVADHGLSPEDWFLSRVDVWSGLASRFPTVFNLLRQNRVARWILERAFGVSRHRCLPRANRGSFLRRADRLGLTRPRPHEPGPRVAYLIDIAANHFDAELAESVIALLRHAGVNVFVPKPQRGSGMPALVAGDVERARELLEANLRVLGNAARDGYTIVCSEPTAALVLRRLARRLTDNLDAELVASSTLDVGDYLHGLVGRGDLPGPTVPIAARVGYHQPCHLRALGRGTPGLNLLRMIPDLEVEFIDLGCSGMAGTFGLASRNIRTSLRAGRGLIRRLRDADLELGSTECFACRLQMEQVGSKRTLHPLKLFALGYGLNPGLRRQLAEPRPTGSCI